MNISPRITRTVSRSLLHVSKHSPILLTSAGIVALVGAGVLAAKATLKLEDTLNAAEERMDRTKKVVEAGEAPKSLVTTAYTKNVVDIAKLYWLPATLAIGGVILVLAGHRVLNQRYAGMVVAYKGLETAFKNYRERVVEKYGAEVDNEFRLGIRNDKVLEGGKKKDVQTLDSALISDYVFEFDESNYNWVPNHEHNLFFLSGHQNIFNDILRSRGHLFLSEVLDGLGIERTPASIVTGWIYNPDDRTIDNTVDFGIKDFWAEHGKILLDFNVDGTVFDKI